MVLKLTDEMREALRQGIGGPVRVEDDQSHKSFLLINAEHLQHLLNERLGRELDIGIKAAQEGDLRPWDVEAFLAKAHELHRQRDID